MPILSDSDKAKITQLGGAGVHFINVSYCRTPGDVQEVRTFLNGCALFHSSSFRGDGVGDQEHAEDAQARVVTLCSVPLQQCCPKRPAVCQSCIASPPLYW